MCTHSLLAGLVAEGEVQPRCMAGGFTFACGHSHGQDESTPGTGGTRGALPMPRHSWLGMQPLPVGPMPLHSSAACLLTSKLPNLVQRPMPKGCGTSCASWWLGMGLPHWPLTGPFLLRML